MSISRNKSALDPSIVKRVYENYVPSLHISEDEKQSILSSQNDEKSKNFCEKVFNQNQNLLATISENYQQMSDLFAQFNNNLQKLEPSLFIDVATSSRMVEKKQEPKGDPKHIEFDNIKDISEINKKCSEFEAQIKAHNAKIEEQNKAIESLVSTSIPEDDDFIKKWTAEKKVSMDYVDENALTELTYRKSFKHDYQMKLMKMIFQSAFYENIEEKGAEEEKKVKENENTADISNVNKKLFKIYHNITFEIFKRKCFDAYKFKNQLLNYDDWVVDERFVYFMDTNPPAKDKDGKIMKPIPLSKRLTIYENELTLMKLNSLESATNAIRDLKNEAMKYEGDKDLEDIFMPLIDVVQNMIFLRICKTRMEQHKNKLAELRKFVIDKNKQITEFNGKIELLKDLKKKMLADGFAEPKEDKKERCVNPEVSIDPKVLETKKTIAQMKNIKNMIEKNYYDMMKSVGDKVIKAKDLK